MTLFNFSNPGLHLADISDDEGSPTLRIVGVASLIVGVAALGLYVGRELRLRYKFHRRTPYDFYSKAGDPVAITEYGMGV